MKKGIRNTIAVMVLLLLTACGQKDKGSNTFDDNEKTPTPIEAPTCTPIADISQVPNLHPTAGPTVTAVPSITQAVTPLPSTEPTVSIIPELEPSLEPTITEQPTPTTVPKVEPTTSATQSPEPTLEPTVTATPSPEPTPEPTLTPSPIPTPTINPDPLITNGWQKMISVDEKYKIIFPELYNESAVTKTDKELEISYSCADNTDIALTIGYTMLQKREYFIHEILSVGGNIIEERPSEKRTTCVWQLENKKYLAVFIDEDYSKDLLGPIFGDEEWIPGVMHVVFSYPADKCDIYETEQYGFYIVNNGEE